jgi:uncharacterized protein (TIGR03118 family)
MNLTPWTKRAHRVPQQDVSPSKSTPVLPLAAAALLLAIGAHATAQTPGSYQLTPILSDGYATAPVTDPNFIDPWGFDNTGTFWINTNVSGYSYVNGVNGVVKLKAIVPAANGTGTGKPTGIVKNSTTGFILSNNAVPSFIFGTLDGTISGWNGALGGTLPSLIMVNNSAANAVYTDIALDPSANGTVLLAANFGAGGKVEIYNQSYAPTTLAGTFTDPNVPSGYAPYAIHVISGQVYVTYMLRSTTPTSGSGYGASGSPSYSEILGPNTGFISVFDVNGNFISRAITGGNLNAPWGMALAPSSFGVYGGDLLVGNLGDGLINVYNPTTFAYLGQLTDATGKPILYSLPGAGIANSYAGLWEIGFGKGNATTNSPAIASSGDPSILYFAVGLDAEQHGLFGSISAVPSSGTPNFAFSSSTPVLNVKAGQTTSATLAFAPINGFSGTVTLACSGLPVDATCSFSPATVTLTSAAATSTTMTITTDIATASLAHSNSAAPTYAGLALLPAGLLVLVLLGRRRNLGAIRVLVLAVMAAAGASAVSGCSSSSAALPVTPPGTSAIKVTATSGAVSQTTTINVTVQ